MRGLGLCSKQVVFREGFKPLEKWRQLSYETGKLKRSVRLDDSEPRPPAQPAHSPRRTHTRCHRALGERCLREGLRALDALIQQLRRLGLQS